MIFLSPVGKVILLCICPQVYAHYSNIVENQTHINVFATLEKFADAEQFFIDTLVDIYFCGICIVACPPYLFNPGRL